PLRINLMRRLGTHRAFQPAEVVNPVENPCRRQLVCYQPLRRPVSCIRIGREALVVEVIADLQLRTVEMKSVLGCKFHTDRAVAIRIVDVVNLERWDEVPGEFVRQAYARVGLHDTVADSRGSSGQQVVTYAGFEGGVIQVDCRLQRTDRQVPSLRVNAAESAAY